MEIFLLRHGIAEDVSPTGRDEDRQLTEIGIHKLRGCARALLGLKIEPDALLVSPYVRAQETARVLLKEWGKSIALRTTDALVPNAPCAKAIQEIARLQAQSVMLIGHEPHLSSLISLLISGGTQIAITMKKAGCCKLTFEGPPEPGTAILEWLVSPKHLLYLVS